LTGQKIGQVYEAQKIFDVAVRGTPNFLRDVDAIRNLTIDRPQGEAVAIRDARSFRMGFVSLGFNFDCLCRRVVDPAAPWLGFGIPALHRGSLCWVVPLSTQRSTTGATSPRAPCSAGASADQSISCAARSPRVCRCDEGGNRRPLGVVKRQNPPTFN
jgi:hypothetical protein